MTRILALFVMAERLALFEMAERVALFGMAEKAACELAELAAADCEAAACSTCCWSFVRREGGSWKAAAVALDLRVWRDAPFGAGAMPDVLLDLARFSERSGHPPSLLSVAH